MWGGTRDRQVARGDKMALRLPLLAVGLAAALATCGAFGETPEEMYLSLFKAEGDRVLASGAAGDRVAFAGKLLEAARRTSDRPTQAYFCQKAIEFAARAPEGCPTVAQATALLCEAAPDMKAAALEKAVRICEGFYHVGLSEPMRHLVGETYVDALLLAAEAKTEPNSLAEVVRLLAKAEAVARTGPACQARVASARLEMAKAEQAIQREQAKLDAEWKADPERTAARRRLMMLLLTERDQPLRAREHLAADEKDEALRANLPLACKGVRELSEEDAFKLGAWYRALAPQARPAVRTRMLDRAAAAYQRFLELHGQDDPRTWLACKTLLEISWERAQAQAEINGGWLDLLPLVCRPKESLRAGALHKPGEELRHAGGEMVLLQYEPPAEYDLECAFTRREGGEAVRFTCPMGASGFTCCLGIASNQICGLMLVRGQSLNPNGRNPTGVNLGLENNRRHTAVIRVRNNAVGVWLDAKQIIELRTQAKDLAVPGNFAVSNPRALGVGVMAGCRADFHAIWVKELSGKGKFAASEPAGG